jgi:hypothetical protein
MAAYVGFRGHIWVHVSFLARRSKITSSKRRRGKDDPIKHFFAELRYDHHFGTPMVETCTIISKWPAFFDIANFWYIFEFYFFTYHHSFLLHRQKKHRSKAT